ncbi:MAG: glycosyltransferase family 39 protein [bacterium]
MKEKLLRSCFIGLVSLAVLVAVLSLFSSPVGTFHDDVIYILAAKSLLSGTYSTLYTIQNELLTTYYPGYPMVLAISSLFFTFHEITFRFVNLLMLFGTILIFYRFIKREGQEKIVLYGTLLLMLMHPLYISYIGAVMSDITFLCVSLLFIYLVTTFEDHAQGRKRTIVFYSILCVAVFSFYVRPTGIVNCVFFLLYLLWRRKYALCVYSTLLVCISLSPLLIFNYLGSGSAVHYIDYLLECHAAGSYSQVVESFITIMYKNCRYYIFLLLNKSIFLLPDSILQKYLINCFFLMANGLVLVAGYTVLRKSRRMQLYMLWAGVYFVLHMFWANFSGRYLLPLIPLIIYMYYTGIIRIASRYTVRVQGYILVFIVLCSVISFIPPGVQRVTVSLRNYLQRTVIPYDYLRWIDANIPDAATCMNLNPANLFYYTGNRGIDFYYEPNADSFFSYVNQHGIDYILLEEYRSKIKSKYLFDHQVAGSAYVRLFTMHEQQGLLARYISVYRDEKHHVEIYKVQYDPTFCNRYKIFKRCEQLYLSGRYNTAAEFIPTMLTEFPKAGSVHLLAGFIYLNLQQNKKAFFHFTQAQTIIPYNPRVYMGFGIIHAVANQRDHSKKAFLKAESLARAIHDSLLLKNIMILKESLQII